MTLQTTSFTILGAGLMGRLLAVALARQGHAVSIYDNGGPLAEHSAARVAGGMIAPLAESAITEHGVVRMGRHSLTRWPELLGQLSAPVFFQQEGTLIVWHRQDAQEAARLRQQLAPARRVAHGHVQEEIAGRIGVEQQVGALCCRVEEQPHVAHQRAVAREGFGRRHLLARRQFACRLAQGLPFGPQVEIGALSHRLIHRRHHRLRLQRHRRRRPGGPLLEGRRGQLRILHAQDQ